jgi:hypothetical protein
MSLEKRLRALVVDSKRIAEELDRRADAEEKDAEKGDLMAAGLMHEQRGQSVGIRQMIHAIENVLRESVK